MPITVASRHTHTSLVWDISHCVVFVSVCTHTTSVYKLEACTEDVSTVYTETIHSTVEPVHIWSLHVSLRMYVCILVWIRTRLCLMYQTVVCME